LGEELRPDSSSTFAHHGRRAVGEERAGPALATLKGAVEEERLGEEQSVTDGI
jgi:hypothetical protein